MEIVVDGYSWCFNYLKISAMDSIIGMDIQELFYKIKKFVQKFGELDVKLVFFFDGYVDDKKRETYLRRRKDNLSVVLSVFQEIEGGKSFAYINENYEIKFIRESLLYAGLKSCGCEVRI